MLCGHNRILTPRWYDAVITSKPNVQTVERTFGGEGVWSIPAGQDLLDSTNAKISRQHVGQIATPLLIALCGTSTT